MAYNPKPQQNPNRSTHPAEAFNPVEFTFRPPPSSSDPIKPSPVHSTPLTWVGNVQTLHYLAAKLSVAKEFAVDLEGGYLRRPGSVQVVTSLLQISTRIEDFIVDVVKLRSHYVRDVIGKFFSDPNKKKIMHGADNDIIWLQRDFGIYVVNMFDTMQASRVMQLERNSLEFLLNYFCGVSTNKKYQRANWQMRPLPSDMLKYARIDTHYLLYIYDLMRKQLVSRSMDFGYEDSLGEVYKRSHKVCFRK